MVNYDFIHRRVYGRGLVGTAAPLAECVSNKTMPNLTKKSRARYPVIPINFDYF